MSVHAWSFTPNVFVVVVVFSVLDIRDENHGKIFAMHLVNHLKSLHASSRSVSTNDELLNKIACITPISQLFKVTIIPLYQTCALLDL